MTVQEDQKTKSPFLVGELRIAKGDLGFLVEKTI